MRRCKTLGQEQRKRYIELGKYCEDCQTKDSTSQDTNQDTDEDTNKNNDSNSNTNIIIK